jgi:hypothetical protein
MRLSENVHLPFDKPFDRLTVLSKVEGLMALSQVEGLRYPHPSSLRRTFMYASRRYRPLAVIPRDFGSSRPASGIYDRAGFRKAQLAYGHFPSASKKSVFRQSL